MRILAIETTDQSGSIAALDGERVLCSRGLDAGKRSAQALAPALVAMLSDIGWQPSDVELVGVAVGPGSFTGLRVGVTTAKMFAYAVGCQVMGVNTLEAVAWQAPPDARDVWTVLDAQRSEVFAGRFLIEAGPPGRLEGRVMLLTEAAWLAELMPGQAVSGPGLMKLCDRIPAGVRIVDRGLWSPQALSVGHLALRQFAAGQRDDLWKLVPQYFRRSAAEEKLARRSEVL